MTRSQLRILDAAAAAAVLLLRLTAIGILVVPISLLIFLSFGQDPYTVIPPTGYSVRWYFNILDEPEFLAGFLLSLHIAALVTVFALVAGVLAAYGQWRYRVLPGRVLETVFSLPILVPAVVIGMSLVVLLSGIGSYNAFWNIVIGHSILTLPFVFRAVAVALSRYDRSLDEAAASMGANSLDVFWHVTLPQVRSGIFAGGLFAFILSFDDFAITIFLIDSDTVPLPVAMYHYMEWNMDPTLSAVSSLLIVMAIAVAVLIDRTVGLDRFLGIR